jgi:oligopeptidase B
MIRHVLTGGDYLYYYKQEKGKNYKIHFRKKDNGDAEGQMILDENVIAEKLNYCSIEILPSPDNKILAYMVDSVGDFSYTVYFKNLETGEMLKDSLKHAGVQEWSNDNKSILRCLRQRKLAFVHARLTIK